MLLGLEENRTVSGGAAIASFHPSVKLPRDRPAILLYSPINIEYNISRWRRMPARAM
jgi:hypothetical protein